MLRGRLLLLLLSPTGEGLTNLFSLTGDLFTEAETNNDPVQWGKRHGINLWSVQREIAQAVSAHKRVAVRAGNGLGKSYLAAEIASWWVSIHPPLLTRVVTTAPSVDQVHGILWEEIRGIHTTAGLMGKVQLTDRWLIGNRMVAIGRKPPDYNEAAFLGYHADHLLVIIDEACGIPEWIWGATERLALGEHNHVLAIGNPDDPNSHFATLFRPGSPWKTFKISAFDSPAYTGEESPSPAMTTREWVEARKLDWGEDNPLYISGVLAEFPVDSEWAVIRTSDIYACRTAQPPRSREELLPVELGVDVGGGGDETIIRERRGIKAGREWRDHSDRPENLARLVVHAINESGATAVKVDSIGIGWGLVGELRNLRSVGAHNARIYAVNVSEKATRPDLYFNLRSQLWWECGRLAAESHAMDLSEMQDVNDVTIAQLLDVRYEHDLKGRIRVESKDEIRKRGRSPDNADAFLLAYLEPSDMATDWFDIIMGRK